MSETKRAQASGPASAATSDAPTFVARGLCKRFRRQVVLDHLELELAPGQVTALLGRNGVGKSTLFRLALGVLKADAGSLRVAGFDPLKQSRLLRQSIGYVPDRPDVYDWMKVGDLFRFLRPQYPTWDDAYARQLVDSLCVPTHTKFKSLSRGEGMKAMLAAALAPRPKLLLLDEPFAGLDPLVREEVMRGVIAQFRAGERTVLVATHDLDVVARVADRVAVLANGRIATHGTLDEVLKHSSSSAGSPSLASAAGGDEWQGDATAALRDVLAEATT